MSFLTSAGNFEYHQCFEYSKTPKYLKSTFNFLISFCYSTESCFINVGIKIVFHSLSTTKIK